MIFRNQAIQKFLLITGVILFVSSHPSSGKTEYLPRIPNSGSFTCFTCHTASIPARNDFGTDFRNGGRVWSATLAGKDSDQDGHTNGVELLDPNGVWTQGQSDPGNPLDVTNPGVADNFPTPTSSPTPSPTETPIAPTPTMTPTPSLTAVPTQTPTPTEPPLGIDDWQDY